MHKTNLMNIKIMQQQVSMTRRGQCGGKPSLSYIILNSTSAGAAAAATKVLDVAVSKCIGPQSQSLSESETETCVRHLPVGRLHSRSNIKFLAYVVIFMARERGREKETTSTARTGM